MDPARVKHSLVWNFFCTIGEGGGNGGGGTASGGSGDAVARCRLCQALIRRKNANTTNLWSHLKSNHPELYPSVSAATLAGGNGALLEQVRFVRCLIA